MPRMESRRCPTCKRATRIRRSRRHGFSENTLLSILLLTPYRCDSCGGRFYGLAFNNFDGMPPPEQITEKFSTSFLAAEDTRNFQELIHEIAEAEKKMKLTGDQRTNKQ